MPLLSALLPLSPRLNLVSFIFSFDRLADDLKKSHELTIFFAASKATALNAEKSPAVPFLPYPENLKGYTGDDIGFDPLRISDYFPMDYLRESELK